MILLIRLIILRIRIHHIEHNLILLGIKANKMPIRISNRFNKIIKVPSLSIKYIFFPIMKYLGQYLIY